MSEVSGAHRDNCVTEASEYKYFAGIIICSMSFAH